MNIREIKGQQIAQTSRITRTKKGWLVPSQSGGGRYLVYTKSLLSEPECTCPDFELNRKPCKHIFAVEMLMKNEMNEPKRKIKTKKKTYPQDWKAYDKAKTREKILFLKLLNDLCDSIPNPEYEFGRPSELLSDMMFASALKVYSTFSFRRFMSDMQLAKKEKYVSKISHFGTVAKYMKNPELTPILLQLIQKSSLPLSKVDTDFAVDSSGFSTSRFDRWYSFKYGKTVSSRIWVKAHLMSGVKTNIVTGVKITKAYAHDSPYFAELVNKTAENFEIEEVSADKGYTSRKNMELVAELGGTPYIPFKSNVSGKKGGGSMWGRMYYLFMFKRDEFLQHYHKRSNVETVFSMIKAKFGDFVRSKTKTAQVNEVLLKILCHNICVVIQEMFELGIKADFLNENLKNNGKIC